MITTNTAEHQHTHHIHMLICFLRCQQHNKQTTKKGCRWKGSFSVKPCLHHSTNQKYTIEVFEPLVCSSFLLFWRGEVRWGEVRWGEVRWGEVRWGEVRWGEVRWGEVRWGEVRWGEMRWRWGEVRWGEVRWGIGIYCIIDFFPPLFSYFSCAETYLPLVLTEMNGPSYKLYSEISIPS